jgi:hypothetical protein
MTSIYSYKHMNQVGTRGSSYFFEQTGPVRSVSLFTSANLSAEGVTITHVPQPRPFNQVTNTGTSAAGRAPHAATYITGRAVMPRR